MVPPAPGFSNRPLTPMRPRNMNKILCIFLVCLCCGCASKSGPQQPTGPYYYMSAPSKEGYQPPGDLSEKEARAAGVRGFPYYVAYFDSKGKPEKILKVSAAGTEVLEE